MNKRFPAILAALSSIAVAGVVVDAGLKSANLPLDGDLAHLMPGVDDKGAGVKGAAADAKAVR